MKIQVMSDILKANDLLARDIEKLLREKGVVAWNIMGSPGAGKTALLEKLIPMLPENVRSAVIEGDLATSNDAQRIARTGAQSTQINTNGACHLDAAMVRTAIDSLELDGVSILFIENVGNLVCPSSFQLGENGRIIVTSITEGDDKPSKYPVVFHNARVALVTKVDLIEHTDFSMEAATRDMLASNPDLRILPVSARTGQGMDAWLELIEQEAAERIKNRL